MKHGFFTTGATYNLATGAFTAPPHDEPSVSHLSAVFGLPEICAELIALVEIPEFERAWLQYCELYNAPADEQQRLLGARLRGNALTMPHSRLTAYAAWKKHDPQLAARAWREFAGGRFSGEGASGRTQRVEGPVVLNPIEEARWISTNDASQWALAAMQNLALIGDSAPA